MPNGAIIVTRMHAHVARVQGGKRLSSTYLVLGNKKAALLVAHKRRHKFYIGKRMRVDRHELHPRHCPRAFIVPRMHEMQKTTVSPGTSVPTASNLTASTSSIYSSSGVSQGSKPLTSGT